MLKFVLEQVRPFKAWDFTQRAGLGVCGSDGFIDVANKLMSSHVNVKLA